jgi:hypothetical protein
MRSFRVFYDNGWWADELATDKAEVRAKVAPMCVQFECRIVSIQPVRGVEQVMGN